jgi:TRAP-type mannitol/chloroaromatic compound transport system substrate-binding protein
MVIVPQSQPGTRSNKEEKMRRQYLGWLLLAAVLCVSFVPACTPSNAGQANAGGNPVGTEVFDWRVQSVFSPAHVPFKLLDDMTQRIALISQGRLNMELHSSGTLLPDYELFAAVGKGTLQGFTASPGRWMGLEAGLAPYANHPGAFNGDDYLTWYHGFGAIEAMREYYSTQNLYFVDTFGHGTEPINSTIPLRGVDDMVGTKGRMGGVFADVVAALGGSPVMIDHPEVYTSLQTRVIDWADAADMPSNWDTGLQEVCPYLVFPGFHQTCSMSELAVNADAWNALPDDLKALVHMAMRELQEELRVQMDWQSALTVEKHLNYGTEIIAWPNEELEKVAAVIARLEDEQWMARSVMFSEAVQSMRDFWRAFGPYKHSTMTKAIAN